MQFSDRIDEVRRRMQEAGVELMLAFHDGVHSVEGSNAVFLLTGFKSLGPAAVLFPRMGPAVLLVTPEWDAERARQQLPQIRVAGYDDLAAGLAAELPAAATGATRTATAGLGCLAWPLAEAVRRIAGGAWSADDIVFLPGRTKTDEQLDRARVATHIAEQGYARLLDIARVGMREDDLAADIHWYMRSLGADDNFLLLCSGGHLRAVQPASDKRLEPGDSVLAEISPSFQGQMSQICRTAVVGPPSQAIRKGYSLCIEAMNSGFDALRPGATMGDACGAINTVLSAEGYGEYCFPPYIRRRGHGLGAGSSLPGDVSMDNANVLEAGSFFVLHPNQYLPETGYLLCGEPVVITAGGSEVLTRTRAYLGEIAT